MQDIIGEAAGVPYLAVPPGGGPRPDAPVVVAWHLLDPPRTERAFAAALPLAGLDAWRIHLGLPLSGSRSPGDEELMRLGFEDAVLKLHGPIPQRALEEAGPALAVLRDELGIGDGPVGVLGGSAGAAVAQLVLTERVLPVRAAVLVSPVVSLRPLVDALGRRFGFAYSWSPAADAVAASRDFVARAAEFGDVAVRLVVGADDAPDGVLAPARALAEALPVADLVVVEGMEHALAEAPGDEPAPQTPHAAEVDAHAVAWFRRHLGA